MKHLIEYIALIFLIACIVILPTYVSAHGHHSSPSPVVTTTTINNTTIINEDSESSAALAGAMGMHYFSRSTKNWQGSVSGACWELSEHCALSVAMAKRQDEFLWAVSITSNEHDQMIGGSFGWTFSGN